MAIKACPTHAGQERWLQTSSRPCHHSGSKARAGGRIVNQSGFSACRTCPDCPSLTALAKKEKDSAEEEVEKEKEDEARHGAAAATAACLTDTSIRSNSCAHGNCCTCCCALWYSRSRCCSCWCRTLLPLLKNGEEVVVVMREHWLEKRVAIKASPTRAETGARLLEPQACPATRSASKARAGGRINTSSQASARVGRALVALS